MTWYDQLRGWIERPFVGPLCLFAVSLFLAARSAIRLSRSWQTGGTPHKGDKLCALLGTVVLCLCSADVVDLINRDVDSHLSFALKAAAIGFAVAGSVLGLHVAFRPLNFGPAASADRSKRAFLAGGVVLVSLSATAWFGCRFYSAAFPTPEWVDASQTRGGLCESQEFVAWTDRGHEIALYRLEGDPVEPDAKSANRQNGLEDYPEMAILRQSRNVRSNCHGWVFCDGRFVLRGDDVDQILNDNRYSVVDKPEAGDLVLYRDPNGQIAHSGVVRGVLDDGTVMVESKWGVDRRYLHAATDQPYSQLFNYYRSPRHGHRLTITKVLPADLRLSPEDKRALRSVLREVPYAGKNSSGEKAKSPNKAAHHG